MTPANIWEEANHFAAADLIAAFLEKRRGLHLFQRVAVLAVDFCQRTAAQVVDFVRQLVGDQLYCDIQLEVSLFFEGDDR